MVSWHNGLGHGFEDIGGNKLRSGSVEVNIRTPHVKAGSTIFPDLPSGTPGVHIIELDMLLAMKIEANRYKDRADYVELVKANSLGLDYIQTKVVPLIRNAMGKEMAVVLWKKAKEEC